MSNLLEDVIIDALMHGVDRAALVRDHGEPGVCVLIMSDSAAQRMGRPLYQLAMEIGTGAPTDLFTDKTPLPELFATLEKLNADWCPSEIRFGRTVVLAIVFRGAALCERVAALCNAHGCPCSLDRNQPPPGCERMEVRQR